MSGAAYGVGLVLGWGWRGRVPRAELGLEHPAQQLAGLAVGQLGPELNALGRPGGAQALGDPGPQGGLVDGIECGRVDGGLAGVAGLDQHDDGGHRFAPLLVGHPEHGGVGHGGVQEQDLFDLSG